MEKPIKTTRLSVEIDSRLHGQLLKIKRDYGQSMSWQITQMATQWIEAIKNRK